jgi:predicted PhzF superfamily epimerase YddE/YHI9
MDYMAVLNSEAAVRDVKPDFRRLNELDLRGVIITAPGQNVDFVSRFFAPRCGIDEDPVTGSAHCTLAPYWAKRLGRTTLEAIQLSKRTGMVRCRVEADRVFLSGKTVEYLEGMIEIPVR